MSGPSSRCPVDLRTPRNKAVALGAISYYLDHFVVGRFVRSTYGTPVSINYVPWDPEHHRRSHKAYLSITGVIQVETFHPILFKVDVFAFGLRTRAKLTYLGHTGIWYPGVSQEGCWHYYTPSGHWSGYEVPHNPLYGLKEDAAVDG